MNEPGYGGCGAVIDEASSKAIGIAYAADPIVHRCRRHGVRKVDETVGSGGKMSA